MHQAKNQLGRCWCGFRTCAAPAPAPAQQQRQHQHQHLPLLLPPLIVTPTKGSDSAPMSPASPASPASPKEEHAKPIADMDEAERKSRSELMW